VLLKLDLDVQHTHLRAKQCFERERKREGERGWLLRTQTKNNVIQGEVSWVKMTSIMGKIMGTGVTPDKE